ncbi:MAG TPA: hypothetical protein VH595_23465 [Verrucomicrobiae bacterium]|jgi:hypothetical protein|nr:hypothetical protein [Verrucomicrobiae bacterium]
MNTNRIRQLIKKPISLAVCLFALTLTPVVAQQSVISYQWHGVNGNAPATNLTRFNLDFPGGGPKDLVAAIEKATGKPLNAIISEEDSAVSLPPLKMNNVNVAQLFQALEAASIKTVAMSMGNNTWSQYGVNYGFRIAPDQTPTDDSIWYFHSEKPVRPPSTKVCRFYSLEPYLIRGFTVDDITTAIQTGWKMSGETSPPALEYHKETKLLIAFGDPKELDTIQQVLDTLPKTFFHNKKNPPEDASESPGSPTAPAEKPGK